MLLVSDILSLCHLTHINSLINTGKSSITLQFVENHFVASYSPTIENTFQKRLRFKNNEFDIRIVDTAGQVSELQEMKVNY